MIDPFTRRHVALIGGVLGLAIAPVFLTQYLLGIVLLGMIYAMFALSLDLVWGQGGILTFGHAVFFGVGAYITALTVSTSLLAGLLGAVIGAGLLGIGIAGPLFRREVGAEYFAIITLAIAFIATQVARSWESVTGGANGLVLAPPRVLGSSIAFSDMTLYYIVLLGLLGLGVLARRVVSSPFGTALGGLAGNERKARSLGYDPALYRTMAFGIAGGLAGLAGALYALHAGFVSPPLAGFELSTMALVWVLVGGRGTLVGPVLGALGITLFENLVSGVFVFVWTLVLGLTLVALVLAFPAGIVGAMARLDAWAEKRRGSEDG